MGYNGLNSSITSSSTVATRDANSNSGANNFVSKEVVVTGAAGTTTLTAASARIQELVGTSSQTFQLPSATTLTVGWTFEFSNNLSTSANLTLHDGSGSLLANFLPGAYAIVTCLDNSTTAGSWDIHYLVPSVNAWSTQGLSLNGGLAISDLTTSFGVICAGSSPGSSFVETIASAGTSGQVLTSNGPSSLPTFQALSGLGSFTWVTSSATTITAAANTGYILTANSLVTINMPSATAGQVFAFLASGTTSWQISQRIGMQMQLGTQKTTLTTGYFASTQNGDSITLVATGANFFQAIGSVGNIGFA